MLEGSTDKSIAAPSNVPTPAVLIFEKLHPPKIVTSLLKNRAENLGTTIEKTHRVFVKVRAYDMYLRHHSKLSSTKKVECAYSITPAHGTP